MKIGGFTIIRNAIQNDYPVLEAIQSILPVVDEMIVSVGNSTDATVDLIRSISSSKIKIVESVWDQSLRQGGRVLAVETDKAFRQISTDCDWGFYIQGDEVIHEKYHQQILETAEKFKDNPEVEGLLFSYVHFYGTYDYIGDSRRWYDQEVRIIRNDPGIQAYRDAQGFRKNGKKLKVKKTDAFVYHYGWVKDPRLMINKQKSFMDFWETKEDWKKIMETRDVFDYNDFDSLAPFQGTHPAVMQKRIKDKNWQLQLDIRKKKFSLKDRILYWIEKKTGKRLFSYRNYRLI